MSDESPRRIFRLGVGRPDPREAVELEIRHHIQEKVDRLVGEGWSREEAEEEAWRVFGPEARISRELYTIAREREGKMKRVEALSSVAQDVRYALRGLRRSPGFAAAVVVTLGLGLGAVAAVFTVVDGLLLRPLPFHEPERLVKLNLDVERRGVMPFVLMDHTERWTESQDFLSDVALVTTTTVVRTDGPEPELLAAAAVTHELEEVLGVRPMLGRGFRPEDQRAAVPVVVLLAEYWRAQGADPDIVSSTIRLDGNPYEVVGVLPDGVKYPFPGRVKLWIPLADDGTAAGLAQTRVEPVGRLREGVTREQARERADVLARAFQEEEPHRLGWAVQLTPVGSWRASPRTRTSVWVLFGAVSAMLLIALVNGMNLFLVRGTVRARETAVRLALGASRSRLLRQLAVEGVFVGLLAGGLAVVLAAGGVGAMRGLIPAELTFSSVYAFEVETRVLTLTFVLAALSGLLLGLVPGLSRLRESALTHSDFGSRGGGSRGGTRVRSFLVVAEVALSVALLAGAGLFVNSFTRLARVDPGFEADGLAFLTLDLSDRSYPDGTAREEFYSTLEERLTRLPGVKGVSAGSGLPPFGNVSFVVAVEAEDRPLRPEEEQPNMVPHTAVDADFFQVMNVSVVSGRPLGPEDYGRDNVVIDRDVARFLWGDRDPVGRRFRLGEEWEWWTVVGMMDDVKLGGMDDELGDWAIFRLREQDTRSAYQDLAIRFVGSPGSVLPAVRRAVYDIDSRQPISELVTADQLLAESVGFHRFLVSLMTVLATVAATLAAVGVYGVLSFAVSQRKREMGIRISLGADAGRVRALVVGRGLRLGILGLILGLAGSLAGSRFLESLLYGVEPTDPVTLAAISTLALLLVVAASYGPAARATRVDPVEVLHAE